VRDYAATVLGFLAVTIVVFAAGLSVSERLSGDETAGPCERLFSGAICGIALWMAATWLLALAHVLTRATLIGVTVALALAAIALRPRIALPRPSWLLLPVALWTLYALWKGAVLPPLSHDVLAYHLPRAVMLMRAHGWGHFYAADPRITSLPANYELLLADVLAMSGADRLTEWLGTLSFLLFLCGTAAFAERWWPAPRRAAAVLAVAGAPVLLLHSSADKNDVMTCAFAAAALLWGARWSARGGRMPMLLLIVSLALTAGTKPSAGAIAIGLAPFFLPRLRTLRVRDVAAAAAVAALALALLGGVAYIHDAPHGGGGATATTGIAWGDFANLWRVPLLMLSVPFAHDPDTVWVPWRHEPWFWPHYEIFFSHYGTLFTFLVLLLPVCVVRYRRIGDEAMRRERRNASLAAAIALAVILPLRTFPLGLFAAMPRYIAFILPIVVCWTVPPLFDEAARRSRILGATVVAVLTISFAATAVDYATYDFFAPFDYTLWAARHPGTRHIHFPNGRAGFVVDKMAGPYDTIAIDGSFDTWIYPAYGAKLTRNVVLLPQPATPASIPPAATWVMIDRSWTMIWQNPKMTDTGKVWKFIGKGQPSADDVRLLDALLHDPHWRLVYYDRGSNNAVFRRVR